MNVLNFVGPSKPTIKMVETLTLQMKKSRNALARRKTEREIREVVAINGELAMTQGVAF